MKKLTLSGLIIGAVLTGCGDNTEQVELPKFEGVYLIGKSSKLQELELSKEVIIKGRKPTTTDLGLKNAMAAFNDPRFGKSSKIYAFKKDSFKVKIDVKTFFEKGLYVKLPNIYRVHIGKGAATSKDKNMLCHDDSGVKFHSCENGISGREDKVVILRSSEVSENLKFLKPKEEIPAGYYFIWIEEKNNDRFTEAYPFVIE